MASEMPLFPKTADGTTAKPVPATPPAVDPSPAPAPPLKLSPAAEQLLAFYRARAAEASGPIVTAPAAEIAAATGIKLERIGPLRRELLEAGMVIVGRPSGQTPQVSVRTWFCSSNDPTPVPDRIAEVMFVLAGAAGDLSSLVRIFTELDWPVAGDLAEILSLVRRALVLYPPAADGQDGDGNV